MRWKLGLAWGLAVLAGTGGFACQAASAASLSVNAPVRTVGVAGARIQRGTDWQPCVPTLIGDGSDDPFDPLANSRALHADIRHSRLHIYPDAAHGYWFQYAGDWSRRIDSFLR